MDSHRMARRLLTLILPAAIAANPTRLRAEPDPGRSSGGLVVGVGAGWGSFERSNCPDCPRAGGLSGLFELGAPLSERVRIGLVTTAWMKREDPSTTRAAGNACGAVTLFLRPSGGLYARFGVGLATHVIDGELESGFGLLAGSGYEFRPTRSLAAGPYLNWYHGDFDRFSSGVVQVGVAVLVR